MPDASKQMVVVPEREPLTMLEAQRIGLAVNSLARLRRLRKDSATGTGQIMLGSGPMSLSHPLGSDDLTDVLEFLIAREEAFLVSMGVQIERPSLERDPA